MALKFVVSTIIPANPQEIYRAWLDSKSHSLMTGAKARVSAKPGGSFVAWDGYISGKNLEMVPGKKIVQAWRTVEFDDSDPDSRLEISFSRATDGAKITIRHSNLPAHGMQYKQGWVDSYFVPMKTYFGEQ